MANVVWLKRDLRIVDNKALVAAAAAGRPVVLLYVFEPSYWSQPDASARHLAFITECLEDLQADLATLDAHLIIRVGEIDAVLSQIEDDVGVNDLFSHEETGNAWTFERDKCVTQWCSERNVNWQEFRQFGVFRRLKDRDGWAKLWEREMAEPLARLESPLESVSLASEKIPSAEDLGLAQDACPGRQRGGRDAGLELLASFLARRGRVYHREMSSPETAATACSRLSPYLAFGAVSMREVVQRAYDQRKALRLMERDERPMQMRALDAFIARLHWHCHFIQKLESEPTLETRCFHPAFDGARQTEPDDPKLVAWAQGRTGFPFVDACMRSLIATGWINFRMRAMLMAVASYHLWLDWRESGLVLARLFTDYEPGIHWSQSQMQSGTTAINTLRIYNPVKQSRDQDPDGAFIRRWVPELQPVPNDYIHEPWTMPPSVQRECSVLLGETYPERIVDHLLAAKEARSKVTQIRRTPGFYENQKAVYEKHGSRKGPRENRMWKTKRETDDRQGTLDLGPAE